MRTKNDFYIFILSDLDLWPFDLEITSLFADVTGNLSIKYELSTTFRWPVLSERKVCSCDRQTDRQTDRQISQKLRVSALQIVSDDTCRMGQGSFWSWFEVNRSTFQDDVRKKLFLHFVSQRPWPLTFERLVWPLSYSCPGSIMSSQNMKFLFSHFWINRMHGTDRQRDEPLCSVRPSS